MTLLESITDALKVAMRERDALSRETLRMLKSQLGEAELQKGAALNAAEEIAVLARGVKTRLESAEQYEQGGRSDLAEQERAEVEVIRRFLPPPLSEDDARAALRELASAKGFGEKRHTGALIKAAQAAFPGQIDGKLAARLAKDILR